MRIRHVFIGLILPIVLALLIVIGYKVIFPIVIDITSFENNAKRLLEKSKLLRTKANTFDEEETLIKLGKNKMNGFYYRFDEQIRAAQCESSATKEIEKKADAFSFEFNGDDEIEFKLNKGEAVLENGLLKLRYIKDDYLQNTKKLNIAKNNVGEIEIRVRLKKGKRIRLCLSKKKSDLQRWKGALTIYTIPDNKFHTYRIDAEIAIRRRLDYGDTIKMVSLFPSDINGDEVEIDYLRFISKSNKYAKKLHGTTYETINKEMRKAIYTNTPLRLTYLLDIPKGKAFLKFGIGIMESNPPVKFKIMVKYNDVQQEAFSEDITNANNWHDRKIDFSKWSDKRVEISFETESEKRNIAFWSNPIIYTHPKEPFNIIIVLEDTLRADHMSCYGYFRQTTPIKDKLIKKGVIFLNAFSQATKTKPSCPSIMTSLYPTATGVWNSSDALDDKYLTLPEIMRSQGFATGSFIQNSNAGPGGGLHQGFSNLFDFATVGSTADEMYGEKLYSWIEKK